MKRPLVTFALFAYKHEPYIREAVAAALSQTYEPLEIILSDDCSPDRTFDIIQEMVSAYSGPHEIVLNRNPINFGKDRFGMHVNKVVELSHGDLIVFAAGDDISLPGRVQKLAELWYEAGARPGALYSALKIMSDEPDASAKIIYDKTPRKYASAGEYIRDRGIDVLGASVAYTRGVFEKFSELNPSTLFEDRALIFRAFLIGEVIHCNEPLVIYRRHAGNMSGKSILQKDEQLQFWLDKIEVAYAQHAADYIEFSRSARKPLDHRFFSELASAILVNNQVRPLLSGSLPRRLCALAQLLRGVEGSLRKLTITAEVFGISKTVTYSYIKFLAKNVLRVRSH